ncbi:MAG: NAD(P)H-dependent oxidoreductase, partial [Deltaproteobacteria bacterium]|nr:NAD(P)H-dependent oxidoreductase [Deltaproteobacteria bacterium]
MATKVKILAFSGALRAESFNHKLLLVAVQGAKDAGADVTVISLRDYPMPLYDQEIEDATGIPEHAKRFKELMKSHHGFLIASPEYNSSVTAVLKNSLDWASRMEDGEKELAAFSGKVAGLISASPGSLGGLRGLAHLRV